MVYYLEIVAFTMIAIVIITKSNRMIAPVRVMGQAIPQIIANMFGLAFVSVWQI